MKGLRTRVCHLAWYTLTIGLIGLGLSAIVRIWIPLSWWVVFRRCVSIAAALTLLIFMWYVHRQSVRSLGLGSWQAGKRQLLHGVLLGCGTMVGVGAIYLATGVCRLVHLLEPGDARMLLVFIPAAGLIGLLEELTFRGYILQQLLPSSPRLAVLASSTVYALVHLREHMVWPETAFELTGLFLLGVALALSYLKTKQLYLPIGLHASLAYWARMNKAVVGFTDASMQWLVGTSRLVNGVVPWIALALMMLVVGRYAAMEKESSHAG